MFSLVARTSSAPRGAPCEAEVVALRKELGRRANSVRRIVYPGYGMTTAETAELEPVVTSFRSDTRLVSFEEAWQ